MPALLPFALLTGYLGSGKTTLLNRILRDARFRNSLVIINELADLALDGMRLQDVDMEYVVLDSGCVCCTTHADFTNTVARALFRREHGLLPPFERFVLETTGAADPYSLISAFGARGALSHLCYLEMVIATVDGMLGCTQLSEHPEVVAHVQAADHLVITKTDLALTSSHALRARLVELNPLATVTLSPSELDLTALMASGLRDPDTGEANWEAWLRLQAARQAGVRLTRTGAPLNRLAPPVSSAPSSSHQHDSSISTSSVLLDRPVHFQSWCSWVATYVQRYGKRLLRLKAILFTDHFAGPIAFDAVRDIVHAPVELDPKLIPDRQSRIVILCRDIAPLELRLLEESLKQTQVAQ